MTERELRLWMLEESVNDSWWLSVDEETSEELVSLARAADYAAAHPEQSVQLLHASQAEAKTPPWVLLDPSPVMTPEERADLQVGKSRLGLIIQLVLLLAVIGGVVYYLLPEPEVEANPASQVAASREAMLKRLAEVDDLGSPAADGIDASLARSDRIFFITNRNQTAWPSLTIYLDDGYKCEWPDPVPAGATMQIPFRMFTRDGQPLTNGDVDLNKIVLEVPGLRRWEKIF